MDGAGQLLPTRRVGAPDEAAQRVIATRAADARGIQPAGVPLVICVETELFPIVLAYRGSPEYIANWREMFADGRAYTHIAIVSVCNVPHPPRPRLFRV